MIKGYEPKPFQGSIGRESMKYNVDKSGIKLPDYKGSIDSKDIKTVPKEYKQTIDPRVKRKTNRPPPAQPKPKPPKPEPRRAANPALRQSKFKGYEPNIKWDPKQQQVKSYEPKLYNGNLKHNPEPVKLYELPENYYGFPKGNKPPVKKKVKPNKVEPLPLPPPPPPAPLQRKKTPPKKIPTPPVVPDPLVETPPPPPPPPAAPKRVKTPPLAPVVMPPVPVQHPVYVSYDPPTPEPLPPTRREYYPKPEPFYNSRPEPMFPPMIPISLNDYVSSEPKAKEVATKPRGNPLIPVMYPPTKLYDLSRYSPPPLMWSDLDDPYQIKGSGVPAYSAIGLLLRNPDFYSYY